MRGRGIGAAAERGRWISGSERIVLMPTAKLEALALAAENGKIVFTIWEIAGLFSSHDEFR